jgi:hypothetical protein
MSVHPHLRLPDTPLIQRLSQEILARIAKLGCRSAHNS